MAAVGVVGVAAGVSVHLVCPLFFEIVVVVLRIVDATVQSHLCLLPVPVAVGVVGVAVVPVAVVARCGRCVFRCYFVVSTGVVVVAVAVLGVLLRRAQGAVVVAHRYHTCPYPLLPPTTRSHPLSLSLSLPLSLLPPHATTHSPLCDNHSRSGGTGAFVVGVGGEQLWSHDNDIARQPE